MTETIKEQPKVQEKRLFSEGRGQYTLIDNQKVFHFDFPINITIEENFAAISFMKDEILKAIEAKLKEEKDKVSKEPEEVVAEKVEPPKK